MQGEESPSPPPQQYAPKRHIFTFAVLLTGLLLCLFMALWWSNPNFHQGHFLQYGIKRTKQNFYTSQSTATLQLEVPVTESTKYKVILLWTSFFQERTWYQPVGNQLFHNFKCKYTACDMSVDHSLQSIADILMFHCRNPTKMWPTDRNPNQIYGIFCLESPINSNFAWLGDKMNLTATYRLDSDIPTPYISVIPWNNDSTEVDKPKYISRTPFGQRTKYIIWAVSHCKTQSKRENYAKELAKYIPVDIVGGCGRLKCPRSDHVRCLEKFSRTHRFYFSSENSLCKDYITEKPLGIMRHGDLIPIVLGGADYTKYLPEHSYINARDYKSPKHLAEYLHFLAQNETEYEKYFWWKEAYIVVDRKMKTLFCDLCEVAHKGTFQKTSSSLTNWWRGDACESSSVVPRLLNGHRPL